MKKIFITLFLLLSLLESSIIKDLKLNSKDINKIMTSKEKLYIINRINNFIILKKSLENEKDINKILVRVNNFFNKFKSISDNKNYKRIDYWASRKEFLLKGTGDCEDYVIAKYFTLLELGLKKESFSIIQVRYKNYLHLVLAYKKNKNKMILDNINYKIIDLELRKDLKTLYELKTLEVKKKNRSISLNIIHYKWNDLLKRIDN
ncbi:MAG: transglutaminase-like cysteine peptidase [Campylobacterales bacterium]|nr:transglutaminase-like cysteine peptidase [Campylobacterales bacterium]